MFTFKSIISTWRSRSSGYDRYRLYWQLETTYISLGSSYGANKLLNCIISYSDGPGEGRDDNRSPATIRGDEATAPLRKRSERKDHSLITYV